ncbi:Aste57867_23690 [Aphanomyces stellatus]|uniref:Aste57867_23690 protein n=1 Tax=Aphanomyces stellatus TaxID=120398 RepID=A0A485LP60_9STRA|nr:hypothetical protein As57867_023618 [Aphanomyces stellatus]VFU00335.1 Aste57867_23690 [Aphanomyces stellatus]
METKAAQSCMKRAALGFAVAAAAMPDAFSIRVGLFAAAWGVAIALRSGPPMAQTQAALASGGPTKFNAADSLAPMAHTALAGVDLADAEWLNALASVTMDVTLGGLVKRGVGATKEHAGE